MILVAQTKGGAGKSVTAMQLLAIWAYNRLAEIELVELDDQNKDSSDFDKSVIKSSRVQIGKEVNTRRALDKLIQHVESSYVIADIGGNRTTSMVISELGPKGYDIYVDLFVVPVSSSGRDVLNAKMTIELIKEKIPHYQGDILLVITRSINTEVEDVADEMPDAFELVKEYGLKGPIILPQDTSFAVSRYLGSTVWEIGNNAKEMKEELRSAQFQAKESKDINKGKEISYFNSIVVDCERMKPYLDQQFEKLDEILDLRHVGAAYLAKPTKTKGAAAKTVSEDKISDE